MAKLSASETAMLCTWAAVQTLGGWGYPLVPAAAENPQEEKEHVQRVQED
jgi:hypothetical protein